MMNQFAIISLLISGITILACLAIKSRYWIKARRMGVGHFLKSFFRWYQPYRIYNTSSHNRQVYMKANNRINIIVWLVLTLNVLAYMLHRFM